MTFRFGDYVRARCSAPARAINSTHCAFVSAMCNDLMIGEIGGAWDSERPCDRFPHLNNRELEAAAAGFRAGRVMPR